MHAKLLAILSLTAALASSSCTNSPRTSCYWAGTAPFCGTDGRAIGYTDGTWTLATTTEWQPAAGLNHEGKISVECLNDYGSGCISGYKRLWCRADK